MQAHARIKDNAMETSPNFAPGANAGAPAPKVLVVDDEPEIVEGVIEYLSEDGYNCISALNAKDAIDLVNNDPDIGIVLTDIRMPGMGGMEMANQMKTDAGEGRDIVVVILTGHAGKDEAIAALRLGAHDFLSKPISPDSLTETINSAMATFAKLSARRAFTERLEQSFNEVSASLFRNSKALNEANNVKGSFLSMMGHELRTPLNAIIGFVELMATTKGSLNWERTEEYLDYISISAKRLESTIENILMLTVDYADKLTPVPVSTMASDLLAHTKQFFEASNGVAKGQIVIEPSVGDDLISVDRAMIIKALSCLVDNAFKFSPAGSKIYMGSTCTNAKLVFHVRDTGKGMSAEQIEKAISPMSQIDDNLERIHEGRGIGLTLASKIAVAHGGRLEIESEPNKGTVVKIIIPQ